MLETPRRFCHAFAKAGRRFGVECSGNISAAFGLALLPMVVAGGAAVDYSRASGARSSVQSALDAGVVAAATQSTALTAAQLSQAVTTFFNSNKGTLPIKNVQLTVTTPDATTVAARVTACIDNLFKGVLTSSETCFAAEAEAKRGKNHLEVALVLDNTGSMTANDRIVHLRNAAKLLVDRLEAASTAGGTRTVKVSLVPFVTAVNIKGEGFNSAWMDNNAENPLHGANFDPPAGSPVGAKVNHFSLFNDFKATWKGCVEARPAPYNLDDTPPTAGNGSTLFVPYFAPDDPGVAAAAGNSGSAYNNSYLNEPSAGTDAQKLRSTAKYTFASAAARPIAIVENAPNLSTSENRTNGPNRACPTPILPLSDDFNKVRTNIAAMRHWNGSGTNVSEGLAWGWRVLSPDPPYTEGRSFSDPSVQKVIVLLTDGENVVYGGNFGGSLTMSDYGSYGFMKGGRFGTQDQTAAARNVDGWVQTLCTQLKNRGVLIYALTLEADTPANRSLYGQCASRPDTYITSNQASQLSAIFNNIAEQLIALKLTK